MVFDWFRRRFDSSSSSKSESSSESSQPEATTPPTSDPEDSQGSSSEQDSSGSGAQEDEYLAWAKAAYQNLKQQQGTEALPVSSPEPLAEGLPGDGSIEAKIETTSETIAPEAVDSSKEQPDGATVGVDTPDSEPLTPGENEPSAALEIPFPSTDRPQDDLGQPIPTDTPPETIVPSPEVASTAPSSLLARAELERQQRVERVKAEAIQDPEVIVPTPTEPKKPGPTIAFDEEFQWSAEVLAKEGRAPDQISLEEITWLSRLRQGLDKTRRGVINQLKAAIGQGPLDGDAVMTLEALLLQADVGVQATDTIIESLQTKLRAESLPPDQAIEYLKQLLRDLLDKPLANQPNPILAPDHDRLNIWLVTGVNGAGKTTTIGKLAHLAQKSGYRCLIAAADTFRAAAVQQVQVWGDRTGVEVIANPGKNTDPAAVVYDALAAATARNTELLLVDTAGRLQNKKNLMAELSKIRRTIDKQAQGAHVESLLVLDATLGQNGLRQAEIFAEAADLTGVVLTKLDGTAKGGVALAVVQQLGLPIRFIGAGEGITDLRPFSSYEFVEALLNG